MRTRYGNTQPVFLASLLFLFLYGPPLLFAETIELVTYYPASSNGGDLHVRSITVGTAYQSETPGDGTALIADRVGIGTSAPVGSLQVVGPPNQADTVLFMPGTGTGTIRVGIGTDTPLGPLHVVTGLADPNNDIVLEYSGGDSPSGPEFITRRSRGTPGAPAAVQVGDDLGGLQFIGYNGTSYLGGVAINPVVEQAPVAGQPVAASLQFFTGESPRMTINSAGNVGIGTGAPASTLHVAGGVTIQDGTQAAGRVLTSNAAGLATWQDPSIRLISLKFIANNNVMVQNTTAAYQDITALNRTFTLNQPGYIRFKWYIYYGIGQFRVVNDGVSDAVPIAWEDGNTGNFSRSPAITYVKRYGAGTHTVKLQVRRNLAGAGSARAPACVEMYAVPDALVEFTP